MVNTIGEGFILITNLYKKSKFDTILVADNQNPEGKSSVDQKVGASRNKNKQLVMRKIHINTLHTKLRRSGDDRLHTTKRHLQYRIKGALEVCKYCAKARIKHTFLCKLAE